VLLGPAVLSRAAASRVESAEEAWMLRQSKGVRTSYVREVLDQGGDDELLAQIWMMRQPDDVRESYVTEVLEPKLNATLAPEPANDSPARPLKP
jgi:hypothetical protein